MPQQASYIVRKWTWTMLTDADATAVTFQNSGGATMLVEATAGTTAPATTAGAYSYAPGEGEASNVTLAVLFPGVSGANRLWAYGRDDTTSCEISHA
jgi:hypothetical protein